MMKYCFTLFLLFNMATAMAQVFTFKPAYSMVSSHHEKKHTFSTVDDYQGVSLIVDLDKKTIGSPLNLSQLYTQPLKEIIYNEAGKYYILQTFIEKDKFGTDKHHGFRLQLDEQGEPLYIRKFWGPSDWPKKDSMFTTYYKDLKDIDFLLISEKMKLDTLKVSKIDITLAAYHEMDNVVEKRGRTITWTEGSGKKAVTRILKVFDAFYKVDPDGNMYELHCQQEGTENYFLIQYEYTKRKTVRYDDGKTKRELLHIGSVPLKDTDLMIMRRLWFSYL